MFIYPVIFLLIFQWVPFSRNQTFLLVFLLLSLLAGTFFHTFIQSNIGFLGESYESRLLAIRARPGLKEEKNMSPPNGIGM
jgi:hypothetical protein